MPEKNQVKDSYPTKKEVTHQDLSLFTLHTPVSFAVFSSKKVVWWLGGSGGPTHYRPYLRVLS